MCCKVIFDFIPKIEKSLWNRYALCPSYLNCSFEKKNCYRRGKVSTTSRWLHSWACWSCETAGYEPCIRSAIWEKTEPVKASTTDGAMNGGQVSCTHKHRPPHTLTDKQVICLRSQSMHRASMHVRTYFFKAVLIAFCIIYTCSLSSIYKSYPHRWGVHVERDWIHQNDAKKLWLTFLLTFHNSHETDGKNRKSYVEISAIYN